jgi:hypothetical protein
MVVTAAELGTVITDGDDGKVTVIDPEEDPEIPSPDVKPITQESATPAAVLPGSKYTALWRPRGDLTGEPVDLLGAPLSAAAFNRPVEVGRTVGLEMVDLVAFETGEEVLKFDLVAPTATAGIEHETSTRNSASVVPRRVIRLIGDSRSIPTRMQNSILDQFLRLEDLRSRLMHRRDQSRC